MDYKPAINALYDFTENFCQKDGKCKECDFSMKYGECRLKNMMIKLLFREVDCVKDSLNKNQTKEEEHQLCSDERWLDYLPFSV